MGSACFLGRGLNNVEPLLISEFNNEVQSKLYQSKLKVPLINTSVHTESL